MNIRAVGGSVPQTHWAHRVLGRLLGSAQNDRVVWLDEARPDYSPKEGFHQVDCDHFGYFSEGAIAACRDIINRMPDL